MIREKQGVCTLHWPYTFESVDGYGGDADAELVFHATRGWTVRVNRFRASTSGKDAADLLEAIRFRGKRHWVSAYYVSASPVATELIAAAEADGYERLTDVGMALPFFNASVGRYALPNVGIPDGIMIRRMQIGEYGDVRTRLLPLVSNGTYVASAYGSFDHVSFQAYCPFVAEIDGRIVAHAENNFHHEDGGTMGTVTFARVERVVVEPEFRGRGIAKSLVAALIRDAMDRNCLRVELQVRPDNAPAVQIYQSLGFRHTDVLLFAKTL